MAAGQSAPLANGTSTSTKPIELAISLPSLPGTRVHIHLTILATSVQLFLTSAALNAANSGAALGSFVYAIPDRYNPNTPLCTPIYTVGSSLDFATRLAKVLVRKTGKGCYVGSSVSLSSEFSSGMEEEMEAFRAVFDTVAREVREREHASEG